MSRKVHWLPILAYASLIVTLSHRADPIPFVPPGWLAPDKLWHALEYAIFAALLAWALRRGLALPPSLPAIPWLALAGAGIFAGADEVHQSFVPGRHADWRDWIADLAGAGVAAALCARALRPHRARATIAH
jgi:VanZ family protein